ncbi:MAG: murein transglycosylase A [Desulfobacterales bacterium]|nr:murein transglycosylase A [Desulfobacterales bacterium]
MNKKFIFKALAAVILVILIHILIIIFYTEKEIKITRQTALVKLELSEYPIFMDDLKLKGLTDSLEQSLKYYNKLPKTRTFDFGKDSYDVNHLIKSLENFSLLLSNNSSDSEIRANIIENYAIYKTADKAETKVLFTGYYEPAYKGSLVKTKEYPIPLYTVPDDLLKIDLSLFSDKFKGERDLFARLNKDNQVVPYYDRRGINNIKDFEKRAVPLVWLENRVDRFFLEIQGSGIIFLRDKSILRVHYSSKNGRAYQSIGRYLIANGEIAKENMSMQAIKAWLKKNPDKLDTVLSYNTSFVFFKKEIDGPFGCLGVKVSPMRSIATDTSLFPKGALCFIKTKAPSKENLQFPQGWEDYSGFVFNQDTGGAIKGHLRADLFYGNGEYAELGAGQMNHRGELYFLVLKK